MTVFSFAQVIIGHQVIAAIKLPKIYTSNSFGPIKFDLIQKKTVMNLK